MDAKTLTELHDYYLNSSLAKTAKYAKEIYGITTNRHALSREFRKHGLPVKMANGRDESEVGQRKEFSSPSVRFVARIIELAVQDIRGYQQGRGSYINWASACYFLASNEYRQFLRAVIASTGREIQLDGLTPKGISAEEIARGAMAYKLGGKAVGLAIKGGYDD